MPSAPEQIQDSKSNKSKRVMAKFQPVTITFALIGLIISGLGASSIHNARHRAHEERFNASCIRIEKALTDRFDAYEQVLRGGVAFFESSDEVTRSEWKNYVEWIDIEIDYPGIQGVGYSVVVSPGEIVDLEQRVADDGFEDYKVWPSEDRVPTSAILFLEPFDVRNRRAFGFDMMSEETRRKAMQRAIDFGESSLSGRVILKQEFETAVQPGFLLYLPHYALGVPLTSIEERRAAIRGFVYSPFRMDDFMRGLLGERDNEVGISIKDAQLTGENAKMYEAERLNPDPLFLHTKTLENSGYPWAIQISSSTAFDNEFSILPSLMVALLGSIFTFLGVVVLANSRTTQIRATKIADNMTLAVRERESSILELNRSLEEKVIQRTGKLEAKNKELDSFTYSLSHDLRAPSRHIRNLKQFLVEDFGDDIPDGAGIYLDKIEKATTEMETLIDGMLTFARSGHTDPKLTEIDISKIASEFARSLSADFPERQIKFDVEPGLTATADYAMCAAIIQNLFENALKFTGKEPNAVISFGRTVKSGKTCYFVRDNGVGFDTNHSEKMFTPFQRLHSPAEFSGTGIGLATVKTMIERHNGEIWAESKPGEGAAFYFYFDSNEGESASSLS